MDSVWGALADPTRWRILEMLGSGELSSGEIASAFSVRRATISRHLAVLEGARLVRMEVRGRHRYYSTDPAGFDRAAAALLVIGPAGAEPDRGPVSVEHRQFAPAEVVLASLPDPVDSFVGRGRELDELTSLLAGTRLLTLTGAAGVGKTRLARALAARVAGGYADGVRWVELARVADPGLVGQAVANALNTLEHADLVPSEAAINHLRDKHSLVVLDNCEHVREACADLAGSMVGVCPRVTVLATSQAPIGHPSEAVWRVPPLSLTDIEAAPGAGSEAVQLFSERARLIRTQFTIDADNQQAVNEVCLRLDGLPLAIELAAARIGVLTPTEMVERLNDRFALLSGGRQPELERHQTLRGALDWSYELLPETERRLLRRLSCFVGGCGLPAIEAVCGADGRPILPALESLVAGSLVVGDTSGPRARFRLLETIRAYGAERLAEAGEIDEIRDRHAAWFLGLAEAAEPELTGADVQPWLDRLADDEDNIRAALAWTMAREEEGRALRLAAALTLFWRVRNRFLEGRRWLEAALDVGIKQAPLLRMTALWGAGFMALMLNDLTPAADRLEESLSIAREHDEVRGQARALLLLGNVWLYRESVASPAPAPGVRGLLGESAVLARRAGDTWCLAHALSLIGWALLTSGDPAAARAPIEEALAVARRARDRQSLRIGLTMLGRLAQSLGDRAAAEALLSQGVEVSEELGDSHGVAAGLMSLSEMAVNGGDFGRARNLLERAVTVFRGSGSSAFLAIHALGGVALAVGDVATAKERFTEAAEAVDSSPPSRGMADLGLGRVALAEGALDVARALFDRARAAREGQTEADAMAGLAGIARAEGDLVRAALLHHQALSIRRRLGEGPAIIESLEALACVAGEGGRHDHAARLFGAVHALELASGIERPPARRADHDRTLAAVRTELGRAQFSTEFAAGEKLSLEHAIDYATRGRGARRRPRTGWGSISQAEREVMELAVEGLTNAEIGERLFISPRTAEWHLHQVYGKLRIGSRTQLAREVARRSDPTGSSVG